ncbi:anti-CBASS protein Acb1 family protein [Asticcacaulis endophyticus]|uniref:Anti-CBASS protein Acb1 n=1 Tax=Asticcacaulis endophyticus TaxID=1395890 RepID=A0A918PSH3_9CAUL|nr:anti-CBASS Acb1 family protein [Asticcacaulis endophyticus]GGZ21802.1 hypothetical protein GCM10011273_03230 [Asticcacaulis endophyticus]
MSIVARITDGLTSLVSRMGTDRDKAATTFYGAPMLSDDQIAFGYDGSWLPRKIVDIPAFDSVRAWRDWQAKPEQIEALEAEEKRLGLKAKVQEARRLARLWGGAAIMIGTGDLNPTLPLNMDRVSRGGVKYLTVLSCRFLAAGEIDRDPTSEWYGKPKYYTLANASGQQLTIHPSRLAIFLGAKQADPDLSTNARKGWGDSVLNSVITEIKNTDATAGNIASLVFEAKVDVIRIPGFMQGMMDPGYEARLLKRFTLANTAKGINGTIILDKEEEYETKAASFAGLPDVLDRFLQIVSGAADIPATRLLGQAPAGMNATGDSDLRNYYDRLSADQEIETTPALYRLDECLIRSALGSRPDEVHYRWSPLWQMSAKEKADVFKIKADAARAIAGSGGASPQLMPIEVLSDALVNAFIEDGSLPGLEAAIDEYGKLSEQEPDGDDETAALGAALTDPNARLAANDATPRTLYIRRDVKNAAEIIEHFKVQGVETTLAADDMHVTIAFSKTPIDWLKVGDDWGNVDGELTINAGGPRMMEQFGDATVMVFGAWNLSYRHERVKEAGASWDHQDYNPHITITYALPVGIDIANIEPWKGKIELGVEIFEEIKPNWHAEIAEV